MGLMGRMGPGESAAEGGLGLFGFGKWGKQGSDFLFHVAGGLVPRIKTVDHLRALCSVSRVRQFLRFFLPRVWW